MTPRPDPARAGLVLLTCAVLLAGCATAGSGDTPPAFLEVAPEAMEFAADEDMRFMEVKNTGGASRSAPR